MYKFLAVLILAVALIGCKTAPEVIDTSAVDEKITELADVAGDIDVQTITVYQTVTEIIHNATPEEKARVEKEFNVLRASITKLRAIPAELVRLHSVEAGKLATEISRLRPFELEAEKQRREKWQAILIAVVFAVFLLMFGYLRLKKLL
jgi:hypothetical protein